VTPTLKISLVLIARWQLTKRLAGGETTAAKYGFKVATPELIHNNEGSLTGINDFGCKTIC
jgi:hypothetical protein